MKSAVLTILCAFACASVLADDVNASATATYEDWFSGIGESPTKSDLKPINGAWTMTAASSDNYEVTDSKLVFDLSSDESLTFTPDGSAAPDTNTITRVAITAVFDPVQSFPTLSDAKIAFAVSNTTCCAYVDGEWLELTGSAPSATAEATITAEIKYQGAGGTVTRYVRFLNDSTVYTYGSSEWIAVDEYTANSLEALTLIGSATVATIESEVMIGAAMYNNIKYGTLADAVSAAGSTADATITLLQDSDGDVDLPANIKVDTNGKELSGNVTIAAGATLETTAGTEAINISNYTLPTEGKVTLNLKNATSQKSGDIVVATGAGTGFYPSDKFTVTGGNSNKDYTEMTVNDDGQIVVMVKTSDTQVNGIKIGSSEKSLAGSSNTALRNFLSTYCKTVYEGADSTSANMKAALSESGDNGITKAESFVLGVDPTQTPAQLTATMQPKPAAKDVATDTIKLAIPGITAPTTEKTGASVTYKLYKDDSETATTFSDPSAITIPTETGSYQVKAVVNF